MLRRIFFGKPIREVKLGRWNHKTDKLQEDLKSAWTNSDHCGDAICGRPGETKNIIYDSLQDIDKEKFKTNNNIVKKLKDI